MRVSGRGRLHYLFSFCPIKALAADSAAAVGRIINRGYRVTPVFMRRLKGTQWSSCLPPPPPARLQTAGGRRSTRPKVDLVHSRLLQKKKTEMDPKVFIFVSNVSLEFLQGRVLDVMASVALCAAAGAPAIDFQSLGLCGLQIGPNCGSELPLRSSALSGTGR